MPKCPACKKDIDYLNYHVDVSEGGDYSAGGNFHEKNSEYSGSRFFCPECYAELDINDQEDADAFLAGKKKVEGKKP